MNGEADESIYVCLQNIEKPTKRGKAHRVTRPAYADATAYILLTYRLAMLLPPSEWNLKTNPQRVLAYVDSPSMHGYEPEANKDIEALLSKMYNLLSQYNK